MDEDHILVINDQGEEVLAKILLTFEVDSEHKYVILQDPQSEDGALAFRYDQDNLYEVEEGEEFDIVQEVYEAFEEEKEKEKKRS
ncbi:MAG: DUF1292 domain-containing protein [Erysipelotrichaceae bacterium]|jgi:uncharacterized protein YrzB (UPF0473 family)|nr:DUF1292 domain-containing protein [Erysipelotrichaceae bacterium]